MEENCKTKFSFSHGFVGPILGEKRHNDSNTKIDMEIDTRGSTKKRMIPMEVDHETSQTNENVAGPI